MGEKGVGKLSQETPPPREGEPMGVVRVQLCANHVQYLERLSHATCHVPSGTKRQLSYQV